jgi:rod shape-determining protein MreC
VARIDKIERRADSAFARIYCTPFALMHSTKHVLLLDPVKAQIPDKPRPDPVVGSTKKGSNK